MFGSPTRCQQRFTVWAVAYQRVCQSGRRGQASARRQRRQQRRRPCRKRGCVGGGGVGGGCGGCEAPALIVPLKQTHGKRSSDGRLTLAPRIGIAARPAATNAWKTLERRSADARAADWDCRAARGKRMENALERRSADARAADWDCRAIRGKHAHCAIRVVAAEPFLKRL